MPIATLLASPARADLGPDLAEAQRRHWRGSAIRWLKPGVAAEFEVEAWPADLWGQWQRLQAQGVDLAVQDGQGRRKRLLIADMDSTMIGQECIDELADLAGVGAQVAGITVRAMNGELDFEAALEERVALLAGLPETAVSEVLATRITYSPGGRELVATMKAAGARAVLVSGGFTAFADAVAAHLGFDEARANRLLAAKGRLTGKVARPILGREAKVAALHEVTTAMGIGVAEAMAVGDGANDLGMLALAGAGVALHAKPRVAAECDLRINHGDLSALLYLQGYAEAEFVRDA